MERPTSGLIVLCNVRYCGVHVYGETYELRLSVRPSLSKTNINSQNVIWDLQYAVVLQQST